MEIKKTNRIFAGKSKPNVMEKIGRNLLQIGCHLIFWIVVSYFFTGYSFLRPLAATAFYKEFLSLLFIMMMVYVNYMFLIPKYFLVGKIKTFLLFSFLTIVFAGLGEFMLLRSNIYFYCSAVLPPEQVAHYLWVTVMLLMVRDFCFFSLFFVIRIYQDLLEKYKLEKQVAADKMRTITLLQSSKDAKIVKISDIVYLSHSQNYTFFHTVDGEVYSQYISLKDVESLLPKDAFLRINKGNIVMLSQIVDYNNFSVTLNLMEENEPVVLQISAKNKEGILLKLKENSSNSSMTSRVIDGIKPNIDGIKEEETFFSEEKEETEEVILEEKSLEKEIFNYILSHSGCKIPDIMDAISGKSKSSIERSMRKLKEIGFIEYRGANKNGGYYVKNSKKSAI